MRAAIPTDLLLRLMNATPKQYAAVEKILGSAPHPARGHLIPSAEKEPPMSEDGGRFVLRRELGNWSLRFDGGAAVLRDCRAVELVNYLLKNAPDPAMHAAELENRVDGNPLLGGLGGIGQAEEAGRGAIRVGDVGGVIEERGG